MSVPRIHDSRLPVILLTGFLGSGKTTLLNHLVRQPALSDALVVINEFGSTSLDHLLVTHSTEEQIVELSSGCVCCTLRGDLVTTLRDATWRFAREGRRQFSRVFIETTGLADPVPVIQTLTADPVLASHYRLDAIVTTVDLATGSRTLDQSAEALKQVAVADLLLLTKDDLVDAATRTALRARLHQLNPGAEQHVLPHGELDANTLLALRPPRADASPEDVARWLNAAAYTSLAQPHGHHHAHHDHGHDHDHHHHGHDCCGLDHDDPDAHDAFHTDGIQAHSFVIEAPIPQAAFEAWFDALASTWGERILRIKGILHLAGDPLPTVIHGVQHVFHPPVSLPAWPTAERASTLVFITRDIDRATLARTLEQLRAAADGTAAQGTARDGTAAEGTAANHTATDGTTAPAA